MNTVRFNEWVLDRVEELVFEFGVRREDAESLMRYVRNGGIASEAEARNDDQFLLDFRRIGSAALAERHGKSQQAICKRRRALLKRSPEVERTVATKG